MRAETWGLVRMDHGSATIRSTTRTYSRPYLSLLDEGVEFVHLVIKSSCSDLPL